jgi:hypothetical protein
MAGIKSESVADFMSESVADFARNTHAGFPEQLFSVGLLRIDQSVPARLQ